jgi:hypothetical protein
MACQRIVELNVSIRKNPNIATPDEGLGKYEELRSSFD